MDLTLTEPSIYFGELSNDYVLVRTATPEFHYPRGNDNVTTYYQGKAGVPVGGVLRRLLFALRFGTTDILVTGQIGRESRILFHRSLRDRLETLTPFLTLDKDPYPVVYQRPARLDPGRVHHHDELPVLDPGAAARRPELHPQLGEDRHRRLRRHDDAVSGRADRSDRARRSRASSRGCCARWTTCRRISAATSGTRKTSSAIQAAVYTTYHMTNSTVFYNKEDQWQVPVLG